MQSNKKIIKRYFENRYSAKDYQELKNRFEATPSDPIFIDEMKEHWIEFTEMENPEMNMEPVLQNVHHRIFMEENSKAKTFGLLLNLQRIAAILFIPLLLSGIVWFFYGNNFNHQEVAWAEIQCPNGVRTHFDLPDGTSGYLNSGSILAYPVPFTGERQVKLSGEAFFNVTHNKKLPFHVFTKNLDIKVLGTRFNVLAYNDQDFEEVTLEKGRVDVYNNIQQKISELEPNQQINYNCNTKQFIRKSVNASQYISWIDGKLIFRNEKFGEVAKRMGRWYNVDIIIADKRLNDYIFHATFENEQLEEALKLIELTTPITYQLQKREKSADGSFGTRKVILKFSEEKQRDFK